MSTSHPTGMINLSGVCTEDFISEIMKYFILYMGSKELIWFSHVLLLEKAMAPDTSTLVWKIAWTEEPGRMQSMGLQRVGHDWVTNTLLEWGHGSPPGCQLALRQCGTRLVLRCPSPLACLGGVVGKCCGPLCKVTWASDKNPLGGLPWWFGGYQFACQCRGNRLNPCSGKILHAEGQLSLWATTTKPAL
jgi:hypothetical protein